MSVRTAFAARAPVSLSDVVRVTTAGPNVLVTMANAYDEPFVTCSPRLSSRFLDLLSSEWEAARGGPTVRTPGALRLALCAFFQEFPPRDGPDFDTSDPALSYAIVHIVRGRAYAWNVGGHYVRHARGDVFIDEVANDIRHVRGADGPFEMLGRAANGHRPNPEPHQGLWILSPGDRVDVCSLKCPRELLPRDVPASDADALRLLDSVRAPYIASCSWQEPGPEGRETTPS